MSGRPVMPADQLCNGELKGCVVDGVPVLVARIDGKVCAYVDRCAHLGHRLSEGTLHGGVVTCRAHQWQFDLTTGDGINPHSVALRRLHVCVRWGSVYVDVDSADTRPAEQAGEDGRVVGPVLLRSSVARAIANAICAMNPGTKIESRGAYLRINAPSPCVVRRLAIVRELGSAFKLPGDLELAMPAYRGNMTVTDDDVRWD